MGKGLQAWTAGMLLVFSLILPGSIVTAHSQPVPSPYTVTVDGEGLRITGYSGRGEPNLTLPAALEDKPVVAVGVGAFWGNDELESVTLPDTVTRLDSNAFTNCVNLQSVQGSGLAQIGDAAFYGCDSLTDLTVGGSLLTVGEDLFGDSLPAISVPLSQGIQGWQTSYFTLERDSPTLPMGRVGDTQVTSRHLALYSLLDGYLDIPANDTASLWDQTPLTGTLDNAQITCYGFVDFYSLASREGLYELLLPESRRQLDLRLDGLLGELEQDAALLIAAEQR